MRHVSASKLSIPIHPLVMGLGVLSIALGVAELVAPRRVSRAAGIKRQDSVLRGFGLRELATGIGLLAARNPRPWLWGRVAGDVFDAATLAISADPKKPRRLSLSSAAVIAVGLLDVYTALRARPRAEKKGRPVKSVLADYRRRSGFPRKPSDMRGLATGKKTDRTAAE
jgi:hypothetical protein